MRKTKWHSGPPPSVGWWPVRCAGSAPGTVSWYDGAQWSWFVREAEGIEAASTYGSMKFGVGSSLIQWRHRPVSWPARSRT